MPYVIMSAIISMFALFLDYKWNNNSLLRGKLSPFSIYIWLYIALYIIGGMQLYLTIEQNNIFLTSLYLGLLLPLIILRFQNRINLIPNIRKKTRIIYKYGFFFWLALIILTIISITMVYLYIQKIGFSNLPLVQIWIDHKEAFHGRKIIAVDLEKAYIYRSFMYLLHFLCLVVFALYLQNKNYINIIFFILLFMVSSFSYLISTEKAPFVLFCVSLYLLFTIIRNISWVQISFIYVFIFLAIFFLFGMKLTFGFDNWAEAFNILAFRLFYAQAIGMFYAYYLVPEYIPYLYGASYHLPSFIVPNKFYLERYIFEYYFGNDIRSAPMGVLANSYANFGFSFSIFEYIFTLLIFNVIYTYISKKEDCCSKAMSAWLMVYVSHIITAGSSAAVLLSPHFVLVLCSYFILRFIAKRTYIGSQRARI